MTSVSKGVAWFCIIHSDVTPISKFLKNTIQKLHFHTANVGLHSTYMPAVFPQ